MQIGDWFMDRIVELLNEVRAEIKDLKERVDSLMVPASRKDWYSPEELAQLMKRKPYTVREWARNGRIRSEKDSYTGRRRIPTEEVDRLVAGGGLLSLSKAA